MTNNEELVSVLNDLITINNDRIEGYQKAQHDTDNVNVDLQTMFKEMASQSMKYVQQLTQEVAALGGEATNDTSLSGKVHRAWIGIKTAVTGHERMTVLESCEFGEDAIQKAYETALESDASMDTDIRQLIVSQQNDLKTSHDVVKNFRNVQEKIEEAS